MELALKRLLTVWSLLATQTRLSQFVSPLDIEVFERRAEAEGMTFLTVTLPSLFKVLDRSLAEERLQPVTGFHLKEGCAYPLFLERAWSTIFERSGELGTNSDDIVGAAVACIRQLSAVFYKLKLPYTKEQEESTLSAFKGAECDLQDLDLSNPATRRVLERARKVVHRLLSGVNPFDIRPKHGGGSSSCGVKPWERYCTFRWIERLNAAFPYDEYFYFSPSHLVDNLDELLEAETVEPMARVVFVPKDSRGPRLISCEPRELMYLQQGLWALLRDVVERHPAIRGMIGFSDQSRNQRMAHAGSKNPELYATLDLKEASDRLSMDVVEGLFPENWVRALRATRSLGTELPDKTIVLFNKFAPMGSACCFPVQTICFWAIALAASDMDRDGFNRLFRNRIDRHKDPSISVFGDDIIVPTAQAERTITALELCGLKVNRDKSYWTGSFRESCGGDFYRGVDVVPMRWKHLPLDDNHSRHRVADAFNSIISRYGIEETSEPCRAAFEQWYGPVPVSRDFWTRLPDADKPLWLQRPEGKLFSGLALRGRYTDVPPFYKRRTHRDYQSLVYRIPVESAVTVKVNTDRWGQILRKELQELDPWSVGMAALAKRTRIKYGWSRL
jgi:hypothetical protein